MNHHTRGTLRHPRCRTLIAALIFIAAPAGGQARLLVDGPEFQANSFTTSVQDQAVVASGGVGDFIVVWTSTGQDGFGLGVFAQRFDVAGSPLGSEFQVSENTLGDQHRAAVAVDGNGVMVMVWQGSPAGVRARRFDAGGASLGGEFQVNTTFASEQSFPSVAAASDGGFLVVWEGLGAGSVLQSVVDILAQRFDSAGQPAGTEFLVNSYTTAAQVTPEVAVTGDGTFVVTWQSYSSGGPASDRMIRAQRLASDGTAIGTEFLVNSYITGKRSYPNIAAADDGSFAVVWQDDTGQDGSVKGVFARVFDSNAAALGSEFRVNAYTTGSQYGAQVAAVAEGFVVVWSSTNLGPLGQDGDDAGVFIRSFSAAGLALDSDFQINSYTSASQHHPAVSSTGNGIVVAWNSEGAAQDGDASGVFGQRFVSDATNDASCGDPVSSSSSAIAILGGLVTATDSLAVLQAAVGLTFCPLCLCDVDDSGAVTASDALSVLKFAVGHAVVFACPVCP